MYADVCFLDQHRLQSAPGAPGSVQKKKRGRRADGRQRVIGGEREGGREGGDGAGKPATERANERASERAIIRILQVVDIHASARQVCVICKGDGQRRMHAAHQAS
jgi:hypothetical protein